MGGWKLRRAKLNQALDAEVRHHLELLVHDKMAAGLSREQAMREAAIEFGGQEQIKEELRDVHRLPFLETAWSNFRFGLRQIRRSPTFSLTVILTLALGIGANSAVFSAINAVLLRPLPYPDSDQLVTLQQTQKNAVASLTNVAPVRLSEWSRLNRTFQAISGYYTDEVSELSGELPEKITEGCVAPRFFVMWQVTPLLGRDFTPQEERFGGPQAVIISFRYWQYRFHGDANAIGKQLRLNQSSATVVGVLPPTFRFREKDVAVWWASPMDAPFAQSRESTWFEVFGRLKPGVSIGAAQADLSAIQAELGRMYPKTDGRTVVSVKPLKEVLTATAGRSLWILFGAVSVLLFIACANIAALLIARSSRRTQEISMRYSLGASRSTIIFQLLTECLILALFGSSAGLLVAIWGARLFRHFAASIPRSSEISLDWRIVVYTFGCALMVTLICGLLPAVGATRRSASAKLAATGRTQVSFRHPWQWGLVGVQITLAVILLTAAGLMLRSFQEIGRVQPGFDLHNVLTFRVSAGWGETGNYKALTNRINNTLQMVRQIPGVADAATSGFLPGIPAEQRTEVTVLGYTNDKADAHVAEQSRWVSNGYFSTMKIPLLKGEECGDDARFDTAVVNRSFEKAYFPGRSALGVQVKLTSMMLNTVPTRVIGIAGDARERGIVSAPSPTIYWCINAPYPSPYFLVRTKGEPLALMHAIRENLHKLEPARSVFDISTLEQQLSDDYAEARLRTALLVAFALTAIALGSTGLYGTLSYIVTSKRREIGLRLALGAKPGQIVGYFLFRGITVALTACLAGLILIRASSRLLNGLLFGVTVSDPRTLLAVLGLLMLVAGGASFAPAFRAATLEPVEVLREE